MAPHPWLALMLSGFAVAGLTGTIEPDRCMLDEERVTLIGPRYLPNGADILDICDETPWMGHARGAKYELPEGVAELPDLWAYCRDNHGPGDGFHAPLGLKGCLADHARAVYWADPSE